MSAWRARLAELTGEKVLESPSCQLTKLPKAPSVSFDSERDGSSRKIAGTGDMRAHLLALAEDQGIDVGLVHALPDEEVAGCDGHGDIALRDYLGTLEARTFLDRGLTPPVWGEPVAVTCEGCGPVLLWPECPRMVKACPWCFRRKAGKPIASFVESPLDRWARQDAENTTGSPYFLPSGQSHDQ
ncbi:hypothetical protein [Xanthomonas albilineans]|uniref:hypothetical protein n=1 Tax=Xanthomonas albilineans TaxID=29447 RepID=UPI0011B06448|nr:hypothetical protein [Xanthomonas albilineans]